MAARKPARKPAPRRTGPANQSRGTGQAAPASAAATSPMAGAFYSPEAPGGEPVPFEQPPSATIEPVRSGPFTGSVRSGSVQLERGGSADRDVAEKMASEAITDPVDLDAEIARIRAIRKPIGAYAQKLALPVRNGYHRHWFNDVAGRIEEAGNNGWTHVTGKDGKPISRCVGSGRDKGALYAFAMEIPEVFWLEDQAARNQAATDKIEALKASPFRSPAGVAQAADSGKFYSPEDAPISVVKG